MESSMIKLLLIFILVFISCSNPDPAKDIKERGGWVYYEDKSISVDLDKGNFIGIDKLGNVDLIVLYTDSFSKPSIFPKNINVREIRFLGSLNSEKEINFNNNITEEIFPNSKSLNTLIINNSNLENLNFLIKYKKLENLTISNSQIKSISKLSHLKHLKNLNLNGALVKDLSPLSSLQELKSLAIAGVESENFSSLKNLHNLIKINLSYTQFEMVDVLKGMKNLEEINLSYTKTKSIKALYNLTKIKALFLAGTKVPQNEIADFLRLNPQCIVVHPHERTLPHPREQ